MIQEMQTVAENMQNPKRRPMWITALGILFVLGGLVYILLGAGLTFIAATSLGAFLKLVGLSAVSGILILAAGIFGLVGGVGLLKLKQWGFLASVAFLIAEIPVFSFDVILILINASIIYYLYRNKDLFS